MGIYVNTYERRVRKPKLGSTFNKSQKIWDNFTHFGN